MKGVIDLVTDTDVASEVIISASLSRDTPDIIIMAEETLTSHALETDRYWVVYALDGTTNFAHGFPYFAVSIALIDHGRPAVGTVYAPLLDEFFCAAKGSGSWLNDRPIAVTKTRRLIESLIGTGIPYEIEPNLPGVIRQLETMLPNVRDIRRSGAATLDLAYESCGRLDGFYEINLKPWDTAAGWLLVEEAGGLVSIFSGCHYSTCVPEIVASNGALHRQLIKFL
jgi:myo-inositol-1(or 4)-monophosphatase